MNILSKARQRMDVSCHVNTDTLKPIYFAYSQSTMKYTIILGGNAPNSKNIFTSQKKITGLMVGIKPRNSCESLFKRLEVLTCSM
jgi:hypothetical protein